MNWKVILGTALLVSPFVVFTVGMVHESGWRAAGTVWFAVVAIVAVIYVGIDLIERGTQ